MVAPFSWRVMVGWVCENAFNGFSRQIQHKMANNIVFFLPFKRRFNKNRPSVGFFNFMCFLALNIRMYLFISFGLKRLTK